MRKLNSFILAAVFASSMFYSCDNAEVAPTQDQIPSVTLEKISSLGFSTEGAMRYYDGYLVENDIYLTDSDLENMSKPNHIPSLEQYSTNELVCGPRTITVYAPTGSRGYSAGMIAGLDLAISRYNAMNLSINFQRVTTSNADIVFTRLRKGEERQGILGSAGFPTNCNPYGEIKMSGILESSYGLSTGGIATIMGHEMGHCIGFRHTDYFDRSISCGGATSNEGASTVGANHIPGTPTGATASAKSWMLACTDGGDRPFNADDQTALNYLY